LQNQKRRSYDVRWSPAPAGDILRDIEDVAGHLYLVLFRNIFYSSVNSGLDLFSQQYNFNFGDVALLRIL
jgi:hypothetical protein